MVLCGLLLADNAGMIPSLALMSIVSIGEEFWIGVVENALVLARLDLLDFYSEIRMGMMSFCSGRLLLYETKTR